MAIEPAMIGGKRAPEKSGTDQYYCDLSDDACSKWLGPDGSR